MEFVEDQDIEGGLIKKEAACLIESLPEDQEGHYKVSTSPMEATPTDIHQ